MKLKNVLALPMVFLGISGAAMAGPCDHQVNEYVNWLCAILPAVQRTATSLRDGNSRAFRGSVEFLSVKDGTLAGTAPFVGIFKGEAVLPAIASGDQDLGISGQPDEFGYSYAGPYSSLALPFGAKNVVRSQGKPVGIKIVSAP